MWDRVGAKERRTEASAATTELARRAWSGRHAAKDMAQLGHRVSPQQKAHGKGYGKEDGRECRARPLALKLAPETYARASESVLE